MTVDVRDLDMEGPDGAIPVRVFTPERSRGGLIVYMDAVGVRPELDGMCGEWAAQGYTTFLPDLFWRQGRLLTFPMPPQPGGALDPAMVAANLATTMDMTVADTRAILDRFGGEGRAGWRGSERSVLHGRTARTCGRGGLARQDPLRRLPAWRADGLGRAGLAHLLIPKVQGQLYLAFATDDDTCPDEHQDLLRETLAASGVRGRGPRFAAGHGWMFPDRWSWDEAAATTVKTATLAADGDRGGLMIDLRQLDYFLKIAERRSFTAAAVSCASRSRR